MEKIEWSGQSRTEYKTILAQQNPNVFNTFKTFFKDEMFDYVIEIGTSYGGLSLFLHDQSLEHDFKFITYDWFGFKNGKWSDRTNSLKNMFSGEFPFDFRNKNVFDESTIKEISDILTNNKCLLMCDGGDKPREFNILGKYLTPGSYIMAHDYASDLNNYNSNIKNKVWNWFEIQDSDIQETMDQFNLVKSSYYEIFEQVAWIQCVKK